jgi:flagellar protein FlaG
MNIEALNQQMAPQLQSSRAPELVSENRKKAVDMVQSEQPKQSQVQPEELLSQIKALTEDGLYSVRFENDERSNGLVVKIYDVEKDEVIRQVPAEELLNLKAALADLRGNLVNTAG